VDRNRLDFIAKSIATGAALAALGPRQAQAQNTPPSNPGTNALMSMFDLKCPIFQAPTGNAAGPNVTIAVSRAGALGAIGLSFTPLEPARGTVTKIKTAASRPFAVNYVLASSPRPCRLYWKRERRSSSSPGVCRMSSSSRLCERAVHAWESRLQARAAHETR